MATQNRPQERPLSPHLSIYRWQLSMVQSILHRMTGAALTVGSLLFAWWLIAAAAGPEAFADAQGFLGSWLGLLLLFGWSWALFFHLCNGIRHLAWDAGLGYEIPNANVTGWAALIGSVVLTLLAWLLAGVFVWAEFNR